MLSNAIYIIDESFGCQIKKPLTVRTNNGINQPCISEPSESAVLHAAIHRDLCGQRTGPLADLDPQRFRGHCLFHSGKANRSPSFRTRNLIIFIAGVLDFLSPMSRDLGTELPSDIQGRSRGSSPNPPCSTLIILPRSALSLWC